MEKASEGKKLLFLDPCPVLSRFSTVNSPSYFITNRTKYIYSQQWNTVAGTGCCYYAQWQYGHRSHNDSIRDIYTYTWIYRINARESAKKKKNTQKTQEIDREKTDTTTRTNTDCALSKVSREMGQQRLFNRKGRLDEEEVPK